MNRTILVYLLLVSMGCYGQPFKFTVTNPSAYKRTNELVVISRAEIDKHMIAGESFSFVDENNNAIVTQLDDLDKNGKWDEACFLYSFQANQTVKFTISNKSIDDAASLAHVRLRKKISDTAFGDDLVRDTMPLHNPPTDFSKQPLPLYLTEGPAWENDKVAFRLYFDTRNDKDIFGKTEPALVMDTIGTNTNNSYHKLSHWGMDVLHAGNSLGAGSLAFKVKGIDSVIRLGGGKVLSEVYEKSADGPLRAVFRITYLFEIKERKATIIDEISIWGGQYFYESKVSASGLPEGTELQIGMADFYDNTSGHFTINKASVLYSYGKQSENQDNLGMAIIVPARSFTSIDSLPREIVNVKLEYVHKIYDSYIIGQAISDDSPATYRFYTGWEKSDKQFSSKKGFTSYIAEQTRNFSAPVIVKWY
ncbi:DUF4861 domain-containing protein [Terrimonas sp.]|uniref:DUF4861 family protein n=1 Tax=Terrimonas sp. TaxID=1914338 RepID=UPI000D50A401|nr:DUF4861 family protein [Terrimonas sp.]PVD50241.1 DUF4861 domain-containing protein [Terrimonas sp.]